ncbi:MAG: hypothetical protein KF857_04435 [Fimbriimonadaceae bacterium]|nr:hypothetical protein [Fimbriimonadaceae bacterium]
MPRGKADLRLLAVAAAGAAVAGCAPALEAVRLDMPATPALARPATGTPSVGRTISGAHVKVPAAEPRSVASDVDAVRVADALADLRESQRLELENLAARLYEKDLESLRASRADELMAVNAEYSKEREKLWDELAAAFYAQADAMGRDRIRLAWLVGFPDPDPNSRRKPRRNDLVGKKELEQAALVRKSIVKREDEFWARVELLSSPVRSAYVDKLRKIAAKYMAADERAKEDAKAKAADILSGATSDIETPGVEFGVFVPATGAQEVTLAPMGVSALPKETKSVETVRSPRVEVFLKLKNYRLAQPGEKARDVTEEFARWSRQYNTRP